MKKLILLSISYLAFLLSVYSQQKSLVIFPKVGIGFADKTSCPAFGSSVGYQLANTRVSIDFLLGAKKRRDYVNGDYKDLLIGNAVIKHSKIYKKGLVSAVRNVGAGFVTGEWVENANRNGEYIQSGFGLMFGFDLEYAPMNRLILKLGYEQVLLIQEFSGNGALIFGLGIRFF